MKPDSDFHQAIHACLKALHKTLATATEETRTACGHIERREQNMAIGTIIVVEDLLEQATALYQAVIALHQFKL